MALVVKNKSIKVTWRDRVDERERQLSISIPRTNWLLARAAKRSKRELNHAMRQDELVARNLEDLVASLRLACPPGSGGHWRLDPQLAEEVGAQPPKVRARLKEYGLCPTCTLHDVFAEAATALQKTTHASPGSGEFWARTYRHVVAGFPANPDVATIGEAEIVAFRDYLLCLPGKAAGSTISHEVVRKELGYLRRVFDWARDKGLTATNPVGEVRVARGGDSTEHPYTTPDDARRVVEACVAKGEGELALAIHFARFQGLRIPSEIADLRVEDIVVGEGRDAERRIRIRDKKRRATRHMPVFSSTVGLLTQLGGLKGPPSQLVFPNFAKRGNLSGAFRRAFESAGVVPSYPMALRDSCSRDLLDSGFKEYEHGWLGHTVEVQARTYSDAGRPTDPRLRRCLDFPERGGGGA
jgi:integrase